MKKCIICKKSYENRLCICPECGVKLEELSCDEENSHKTDCAFSHSGDDNHIYFREESSPLSKEVRFQRSKKVVQGIVVECKTQQYYQSGFTKMIRSIFSGEPYQLGYTSYCTVIRVKSKEMMPCSDTFQDIVVFGGIQNLITPGESVTIHIRRKGNQLIARRVISNLTNSCVHIEGNIPAGVVRAFLMLLFAAIIAMVLFVVNIDYAAIGHALLRGMYTLGSAAVTIGVMIYLLKALIWRK